MDNTKLLNALRRKPAVHQLCSGAFLQEPLVLRESLLATPLAALGFDTEANFTRQYVTEVLGGEVSADRYQELLTQGAHAHPVIAITAYREISAAPAELEKVVDKDLIRARQLITWASGDEVTPFAMVTANTEGTFFRLIAPQSRRRQRLGFGNTGDDFYSQLARIDAALDEDEHFALGLSLFHDAVREENPRFRIARFFNVLECLAYKLKKERASRAAIRYMLDLEGGAMVEIADGSNSFRFDVIEIGGRVRDALLHGSAFRPQDLNLASRPAYTLYEERPQEIVGPLQSYCELEIARWANNASRGRNPPPQPSSPDAV
jgi:hypothetical protein